MVLVAGSYTAEAAANAVSVVKLRLEVHWGVVEGIWASPVPLRWGPRPASLAKPCRVAEDKVKADGCCARNGTELQTTSNTKPESRTLSLIFLFIILFFLFSTGG
jgi:hypothetical protein